MAETNVNARLEAFSDGVFSIALTLLIIDIALPAGAAIDTTHAFWLALRDILPSLFSFLLSFVIILINWVNHRNILTLIHRSSHRFVYANGLLLLDIVFIPFPNALLGKYLFTDHAAPAVVLYSVVCVFQAISWNLLIGAALKPPSLATSEKAVLALRQNRNYSYFAFTLYSTCAIVAFWFPKSVAIAITLTWIFWLIVGVTTKGE